MQLFRGFGSASSVERINGTDGQDLAHAFKQAEVAYKANLGSVENNLAWSRGAASAAAIKKAESSKMGDVEVMRAALDGAKAALAKTPEMLSQFWKKLVNDVVTRYRVVSSFMKVSWPAPQVSISLPEDRKTPATRW